MAQSRSGKQTMRDKLPKEVFIKAAHMMDEGKSRKQALGAAAGMMREGRLTSHGKYVRSKRK